MASRPSPGPRERMIVSTALLVRERGARATSIDAVLQHSGAPRGSIYHHFPGGREQLLRESAAYAATFLAERLERHGGDPVACIDWLVAHYCEVLRATEFRAGCPIAAFAVEAGGDGPDLGPDVRQAFDRWRAALEASCTGAGVAPARAAELALSFLAAAEGALLLCRAYRSTEPLETTGRDLRRLLEAELAAEAPPPRAAAADPPQDAAA